MPTPIGVPCSATGCCELSVAKNLCAKHYKRWQRYGDVEAVRRPNDWGRREKHPLYETWRWILRNRLQFVCEEWKEDFWQFARDVGDKPEGARFSRVSEGGLYEAGNVCWRISSKSVESRARSAEYQRKWRTDNIRRARSSELKSSYGITIDDYEKLLEIQNHACAICGGKEGSVQANGKPFGLAVDHCHDTDKVRGLLCSHCNRGLGFFEDSIERLHSAIDYLRRS
jgi:Autographiviridae endonuclease VII